MVYEIRVVDAFPQKERVLHNDKICPSAAEKAVLWE